MIDQDKPMIVKTPCPHCHGLVEIGVSNYKCIGGVKSPSGCGLTIGSVIAGRELSEMEVESLLKYKRVGPLSGFFARRNGRYFSAALHLEPDPDGETLKLEFNFDDASALSGVHDQAKCSLDESHTIAIIKCMPMEIQKIIEEYNIARRSIGDSIEDSTFPCLLKAKLLKSINASDISYSVQGTEKPWPQILRTTSMLCGPMFLSTNSPRPYSKNGVPMFPLLQINLSEISKSTHHLFEDGLLQVWLSSADGECLLRIIPYEELLLPPADILELSDSIFNDALRWVPSAWVSKSRDCGIEVLNIEPVGVSMPDIELLLEGEFDDGCNKASSLLNSLKGLTDMKYSLSTDVRVDKVFNIFGFFRSNVYSCWDEDFDERIFIHSPDWLAGTNNFNLFFSRRDRKNRGFRLSITK